MKQTPKTHNVVSFASSARNEETRTVKPSFLPFVFSLEMICQEEYGNPSVGFATLSCIVIVFLCSTYGVFSSLLFIVYPLFWLLLFLLHKILLYPNFRYEINHERIVFHTGIFIKKQHCMQVDSLKEIVLRKRLFERYYTDENLATIFLHNGAMVQDGTIVLGSSEEHGQKIYSRIIALPQAEEVFAYLRSIAPETVLCLNETIVIPPHTPRPLTTEGEQGYSEEPL